MRAGNYQDGLLVLVSDCGSRYEGVTEAVAGSYIKVSRTHWLWGRVTKWHYCNDVHVIGKLDGQSFYS